MEVGLGYQIGVAVLGLGCGLMGFVFGRLTNVLPKVPHKR